VQNLCNTSNRLPALTKDLGEESDVFQLVKSSPKDDEVRREDCQAGKNPAAVEQGVGDNVGS